jgi:hypothetical protein
MDYKLYLFIDFYGIKGELSHERLLGFSRTFMSFKATIFNGCVYECLDVLHRRL